MTRYVITPDIAVELAAGGHAVGADVALVAPTLLRSQVLTLLYRRVSDGELTSQAAKGHLDDVRALNIRLLGDRVLQGRAWRIASELGWADTYDAEYVALTQLQADALVTGDPVLRGAVGGLVATADIGALIEKES